MENAVVAVHGVVRVLMVLGALPGSIAVQLVAAIGSVATVVVCVVNLPFFKACSLGLRLQVITLA
jgi:hypothetical protein